MDMGRFSMKDRAACLIHIVPVRLSVSVLSWEWKQRERTPFLEEKKMWSREVTVDRPETGLTFIRLFHPATLSLSC